MARLDVRTPAAFSATHVIVYLPGARVPTSNGAIHPKMNCPAELWREWDKVLPAITKVTFAAPKSLGVVATRYGAALVKTLPFRGLIIDGANTDGATRGP
jgi:hypothetical protein